MLMGDSGIIKKAQLAKEKTEEVQKDEEEKLADLEKNIDEYSSTRASYLEGLLFEGRAEEVKSYNLNDNISNYNYIYIWYEERGNNVYHGSELIKVSYINKERVYDYRITSYNTRNVAFHFTENSLVIDGFSGRI